MAHGSIDWEATHEWWLLGVVMEICRVLRKGRPSQDVRTEHPGLLLGSSSLKATVALN